MQSRVIEPTTSAWRARLAAVVVLAYGVPLYDSVTPALVNITVAESLYAEHRRSPDLQSDDLLRQLIPYVPRAGTIGLVLSDAVGSVERQRLHYRLQYALAPRIVVLGTTPEFVVVYGPRESRLPAEDFVLVRQLGDMRLYRRTAK
jgi:hypothetical protein